MTAREAEQKVREEYPDAVCRRLSAGVFVLFEAPKNRRRGSARLSNARYSRAEAWLSAASRLTGE